MKPVREVIRKCIDRLLAAALANGKARGRPKRTLRRDEALRLRELGMSWRKIAARLKVPVTIVVEGCR